jgi:hypothetical protein
VRRWLLPLVVIAAATMCVGALGPWVTQAARSCSGLDVDVDSAVFLGLKLGNGWGVLIAALAAPLIVLLFRRSRVAGAFPVLAGLVGLLITVHLWRLIHPPAIPPFGYLGPPHVGWGLIVSLIGSIALALVGSLFVTTTPEEDDHLLRQPDLLRSYLNAGAQDCAYARSA